MRTFAFVASSLAAIFVVAACTSSGSARLQGSSDAPAASPSPEASTTTPSPEPDAAAPVVRLVTLGDGYTYGTGTVAPPRDSWPAQLADVLRRSGRTVFLFNLAQGSSSSINVRDEQVTQVEAQEPDVVTLQVGGNDIIWRETDLYRENLEAILDELLTFLPPERILAITTPDHTLTEWGKAYGTSEAVAALNRTLFEVGAEYGITVIDISPINALVATDPSLLVQGDPPVPYPSAKQYAGWAEAIGPYVQEALSFDQP